MDLITLGQLRKHKAIDGHGGIYNADIGFKQTRKAYANLQAGATQIYNVVALGDSLTEGGIADALGTNWSSKSWLGLFRASLTTEFQDLGQGFIPPHFPHLQSNWVFGSGCGLIQNSDFNWGIGKSYLLMVGSVAGVVTVPFTGTKCQIITANGSASGNYTYKVDAGAVSGSISTATGDALGLGVTTTNTVTAGVHTLTITKVADGKDLIIFGILPQNANTKGFRVHCNARWGSKVSDFVDMVATDLPTGGSGFNEGIEIVHWAPTLTIIALIANDAMEATPIATYKANMQRLINVAKYVGSDVWLINDGASDQIPTAMLKPYADALLELALLNGCAYSDLASYFGTITTVNESILFDYGVEASDNTHKNATGHQMIGTRVINQFYNSL